MALAALIIASSLADDGGDMPRAVLPLAGSTLLEHQARRAVRAGAGHIVILADHLPNALAEALGRLRRDAIRVDVARSVWDASDRLHPDETVLLIADGCIADADVFDRMSAARAPAVLALADRPGLEEYERLDAHSRWAGLALVEGWRIRDTVADLGEWDLALTLLRRALQAGAPMIRLDEANEEADRPVFVHRAADLDALEQRLIAGSAGAREGWPGRYVFPHLERPLMARLVRARLEPLWLKLAALGLAALAIGVAACGWFVAAFALALASGPIDSLARRLSDLRMTRLRQERRLGELRMLCLAAAMVTLGIRLGDNGQWGWPFLAVSILGVMAALASEWRTAHRLDNRATMPFMATADGIAWLFLPFALVGAWGPALLAALLYALTSFVVAQRMVHDAIVLRMRGPQV